MATSTELDPLHFEKLSIRSEVDFALTRIGGPSPDMGTTIRMDPVDLSYSFARGTYVSAAAELSALLAHEKRYAAGLRVGGGYGLMRVSALFGSSFDKKPYVGLEGGFEVPPGLSGRGLAGGGFFLSGVREMGDMPVDLISFGFRIAYSWW